MTRPLSLAFPPLHQLSTSRATRRCLPNSHTNRLRSRRMTTMAVDCERGMFISIEEGAPLERGRRSRGTSTVTWAVKQGPERRKDPPMRPLNPFSLLLFSHLHHLQSQQPYCENCSTARTAAWCGFISRMSGTPVAWILSAAQVRSAAQRKPFHSKSGQRLGWRTNLANSSKLYC